MLLLIGGIYFTEKVFEVEEKYYIGTKEPSSNVLEFPTAKNVDTGKNN